MQEISGVRYLAKSVAGLKPSGIRKFFDIAATMKDVISLGIGEPDFTTPERSWMQAYVPCEPGKHITPPIRASSNCGRLWPQY